MENKDADQTVTLIKTTSAASTATSVPVPIAIPTWACARAGESLTPSPTIATIKPLSWSERIFSTLCEGRTSANTCCIPTCGETRKILNHATLPTYVWWWIKPDVQSGKRNISATNITELETVVYLSRHEYEFPWGIEPQALGVHALTLYHVVKEILKWAASLRGLHVTHILHTARISNFETVMWKCIDRIRTIMILKLGKETKTDVYSSYHERGTKRCLIL